MFKIIFLTVLYLLLIGLYVLVIVHNKIERYFNFI